MDVVERIKNLMELHKWSVYELSKRADIDSSNIGRMFQRGSVPTVPTIEKIAAAFGLSLSQFFAGEGEPYPVTSEEREELEIWSFLTDHQKKLILSVMLDMHRPPMH